jgi:2-polyprenyl-6-methoxyphenol hydroxylase-like FAD-dependent oxidoreductase
MYDAIVIGARCGGAPTAMLLARKGHRVLLVDRAVFPSDIPHGHLIRRGGPARLASWGLLERVIATGCPPITAMSSDIGDFRLAASDLAVDGVPVALGPRRTALDHVLVDAAVEAGVELRAGFSVESLTMEGDRVTGIRGGDRRTGTSVTERATLTIGADGRNSHVARAVSAPEYQQEPSLTCWYFSYWSDVPSDTLELHDRHGRAIFAFPTNDGLFAVFAAWQISSCRWCARTSSASSSRRSTAFRPLAIGCALAGARTASTGRQTSATSSASRSGRGGRSSVTPGVTRIRIWR